MQATDEIRRRVGLKGTFGNPTPASRTISDPVIVLRIRTAGRRPVPHGPECAPRAVSPKLESGCGFSTMGGGSPPTTISWIGSASTGRPMRSIRRMEFRSDDSGGPSVPDIMQRPRGGGHCAVASGPPSRGRIHRDIHGGGPGQVQGRVRRHPGELVWRGSCDQ